MRTHVHIHVRKHVRIVNMHVRMHNTYVRMHSTHVRTHLSYVRTPVRTYGYAPGTFQLSLFSWLCFALLKLKENDVFELLASLFDRR